MAEKRTKADKLQRSIQRTEKRIGAWPEESLPAAVPGAEPVPATPGAIQSQEELRPRTSEQDDARRRKGGHDLEEAA